MTYSTRALSAQLNRAYSRCRHLCHVCLRSPATSDRQSATRPEMLFPEAVQPAGRKMTPSNVSPVATKRHSAMSSLRANATIITLRVPATAISSTGLVL